MTEELLKHRVLYLLIQGWVDPNKIAIVLDTDSDSILKVIKELESDGAINLHTVH